MLFREAADEVTATSEGDPLEPLWRAARAGDASAIRELLEALSSPIYRVLRGVLRDAPEIDDVAQLAMINVLNALGSFRGECRITRFAVRIAIRTAMASRRKAKRQRDRESAFAQEDAAMAGDPVDARIERLWRWLLDELPEEQAETMLYRVLLEYSLQETADATGAPLNTVRSRLRLARETLQKRMNRDPSLLELVRLDEG